MSPWSLHPLLVKSQDNRNGWYLVVIFQRDGDYHHAQSLGIASQCMIIQYIKTKTFQSIMDRFNIFFVWSNMGVFLVRVIFVLITTMASKDQHVLLIIKDSLIMTSVSLVLQTCFVNGLVQYCLIYKTEWMEKFEDRYTDDQLIKGYIGYIMTLSIIIGSGNVIGYEAGTMTCLAGIYGLICVTLPLNAFVILKIMIWMDNDKPSTHLLSPRLIIATTVYAWRCYCIPSFE